MRFAAPPALASRELWGLLSAVYEAAKLIEAAQDRKLT